MTQRLGRQAGGRLNLQDFQLSCAALDWAVMLVAENKLQVDKEIDQERNPDAQKLCEYRGERYEGCADGGDANIDRQSDQGPQKKQQKSA